MSIIQRIVTSALGALCLAHASAQPLGFDTDPDLLARLVLGQEQGSVSAGVWRQGKAAFAFRRNGAVEPAAQFTEGQQLYEIGSISKVFTGLLLAQAVERGDLALDDNLGKLLQGKARFVSPHVAAITLRQLITHSSCVPRLPPDFSEDYVEGNPYASYDRQRLWFALASLNLASAPPCPASYSNFGVGIVGEILSERYGKPWHVLVRENITAPLGMNDTMQLLGDAAGRMAPAFNNAAPAPLWEFQALAGAGALRSTAADMLVFSRAVMAGRAGPLGAAVERMLMPLGRFQGNEIGYAVLMRGPEGRRTYFHGGGTGGYRTVWLVAPDTQEAAVVLASNAHANANKLVVALTAARYPVPVTPVPIVADQLGAYAGVYRVDKDSAFTFVVQDKTLYRRATGGGFRPLVPTGLDRFADPDLGVQYEFTRQGNAVTGVAHTQGGSGMSAARTAEPAPLLAVIPATSERDYVGRFQRPRVLRRDLSFDVSAEGGQLTVRSGNWQRQPVFPMPGRPDRFAYERPHIQIQFERDVSGNVVALVLHEGGAIRMERVAD